ncbi:hypothetical protein EDC94DRAFT_584186 [Helicostylum pulchrum]|nr:hypothetical protein EDC94DRAFT_584186 [Helicostylum pulchrum]
MVWAGGLRFIVVLEDLFFTSNSPSKTERTKIRRVEINGKIALPVKLCVESNRYQLNKTDLSIMALIPRMICSSSAKGKEKSSDDDASKITCYLKFAKILDDILDNTMFNILDGEKSSKASKDVAANLKKMYPSLQQRFWGFIPWTFAINKDIKKKRKDY